MGGTGYKGKFCTNPIQFIRLPMQNNFLGALRKPRTRIIYSNPLALGLRRQAEDKTT